MIREKKSVRTRFFILIGLYAVLIPFSLAWYNMLINIDCGPTKVFESANVKIGSFMSNKQYCLEQINFHWMKFYGINGVIYSVQLAALIMTMKKKNY